MNTDVKILPQRSTSTLPARDAANRIRLAIQSEGYEAVYQDSRAIEHLAAARLIDERCDGETARLASILDLIEEAARGRDYPTVRAVIQAARHVLANIETLDAAEGKEWEKEAGDHVEMARDAGREVIRLTEPDSQLSTAACYQVGQTYDPATGWVED